MLDYHNRKNKKFWWPIGLTVLVIILVSVLGSFARDLLSGPVIFFTKPLWQGSDNLGTFLSVQASGLGQTRQALLFENKNLREEVNKFKNLLLAKKNVEADNNKLRAILGRAGETEKPLVARVIFLPNFVPYNNLLLDIGQKNCTRPFKVGDLVVADGVVLVGKIVSIDDEYSKVKLLSAETKLAVIIGDKNVPGLAVGSGAGNFTISLPKDTPIFVGDRVRVPLLNNYLIGLVGHIEKVASRPTQTVLVRTPVNLFQLKWLEIYDAKI